MVMSAHAVDSTARIRRRTPTRAVLLIRKYLEGISFRLGYTYSFPFGIIGFDCDAEALNSPYILEDSSTLLS